MKSTFSFLLWGFLVFALLPAPALSSTLESTSTPSLITAATPLPVATRAGAGVPPVTAMTASRAGGEWDSLVAEARKEGSVVVYIAPIGEARDIAAKTFKEKYGISIDFVTGRGAELINKITTERNAGLYTVDAMLMGLGTFFNMIGPMKITVPLEPLLMLPEVTDGTKWRMGNVLFVDKAKTCIAFSLTSLHCISINTDLVKEGEITSFEDILAPKWKGKIVINDPSVGGHGAEWFQFMMLGPTYGKEKGRGYVMKLIEQNPVMNRDQRLQTEWLARGKSLIGIGIEPSEIEKMAKLGAPVKVISVKEGSPLSSGPLNVMVFDRAPHPNAAKLFVNWVLSREGGEIMSKYSGYLSARLDVSTAGFDPIFIPRSTDILPGEQYKLQAGELLKVAADMFKDLK